MKVTKYPQSCFVIESTSKKVMIDPGSFFAEKFSVKDFLDVSAVLLTHQHADHLDLSSIKVFADRKISIYGNTDVVAKLATENVKVNEVNNRKKFSVASLEVEPVDLLHCKVRRCAACKKPIWNIPSGCAEHQDQIEVLDGPPNTGFVINGVFFHPGDGVEVENVLANGVGVPIVGPTINYQDAWKFVKRIKAKKIIPMHYDHLGFVNRDPHEFAKLNPGKVEVRILKDGESTEL